MCSSTFFNPRVFDPISLEATLIQLAWDVDVTSNKAAQCFLLLGLSLMSCCITNQVSINPFSELLYKSWFLFIWSLTCLSVFLPYTVVLFTKASTFELSGANVPPFCSYSLMKSFNWPTLANNILRAATLSPSLSSYFFTVSILEAFTSKGFKPLGNLPFFNKSLTLSLNVLSLFFALASLSWIASITAPRFSSTRVIGSKSS